MTRKNILSAALASTVLMGAQTYAQDTGSYLAFSAGSTDHDNTTELVDAAFSVGASSTSLETTDSGFKLAYGYQFSSAFSVEAAYANLGETTLSAPGTLFGVNFDLSTVVEVTSFSLAAVYQFNEGGTFKPFVKAGLNRWDLDATVSTQITTTSVTVNAGQTGTDIMYGLGFDIAFTDNIALRAEYEIFDLDTTSITDVSFLSVGLKYKF